MAWPTFTVDVTQNSNQIKVYGAVPASELPAGFEAIINGTGNLEVSYGTAVMHDGSNNPYSHLYLVRPYTGVTATSIEMVVKPTGSQFNDVVGIFQNASNLLNSTMAGFRQFVEGSTPVSFQPLDENSEPVSIKTLKMMSDSLELINQSAAENINNFESEYIANKAALESDYLQTKSGLAADYEAKKADLSDVYNAIDKEISGTAVDVFVYDTSKDSDGGAWRKRTQYTSWYNETLNTSKRGSRKEFPSVAVIVASSYPNYDITIYDGDDPDLPIWMVFDNYDERATYRMIGTGDGGSHAACLTMLNGVLAVGTKGSISSGIWDGLFEIKFVQDTAYHYSVNGIYSKFSGSGIADRNSYGYALGSDDDRYTIANAQVNDVAMTVLPSAPIDSATGLPIATIAVATDNGVSVIKDDGSVVDITGYPVSLVTFNEYDEIVSCWKAGAGDAVHIYKIPSSDQGYSTPCEHFIRDSSWSTSCQFNEPFRPIALDVDSDGFILGQEVLGLIKHSYESTPGEGVVGEINPNAYKAIITSKYNTGWMYGDTKLAALSDTDVTPTVGIEFMPDPAFASNDVSYIVDSGGGQSSIIDGALVLTASDGSNYYADHYFIANTEIGKTYIISVDLISTSGPNQTWGIHISPNYLTSSLGDLSIVGTHTFSFIATQTDTNINIVKFGNTLDSTVTIGGWSVRLSEPDRSVNSKGLQVFGTINKTPVATGTDLVAYSGWSKSNYLKVPKDAIDLNGIEFSMMCWIKYTAGNYSQMPMSTGDADSISAFRGMYIFNGNVGAASWGSDYLSNYILQDGKWSFLVINWVIDPAVPNGYKPRIYVDGEFKGQATNHIGGLPFTNTAIDIGGGSINGVYFSSSPLALARISATAPTDAQIKKIYEDEKVLFQESAKATLYGTSDAVTALAYDDDTKLLHVGTSSGRSDFSGLRRVSNTTAAVTTAISASNGFIVEQ
jgi:trimeric autotransporter adhesin